MSYYAEIAEEVWFDAVTEKLSKLLGTDHYGEKIEIDTDALDNAMFNCPAIEGALKEWASKEIDDAVVDNQCGGYDEEAE